MERQRAGEGRSMSVAWVDWVDGWVVVLARSEVSLPLCIGQAMNLFDAYQHIPSYGLAGGAHGRSCLQQYVLARAKWSAWTRPRARLNQTATDRWDPPSSRARDCRLRGGCRELSRRGGRACWREWRIAFRGDFLIKDRPCTFPIFLFVVCTRPSSTHRHLCDTRV
jgi:hypothetical protein